MSHRIEVEDYNLASTLDSGQSFRWKPVRDGWVGVIGQRWALLHQTGRGIEIEVATPTVEWDWLEDYLQVSVDLRSVISEFPMHPLIQAAVSRHYGLRLLRQDSWECLVSFILSSTKQITHIKQIVDRLCERYGQQLPTPLGYGPSYAFPSARTIAELTEAELRDLRMGFRAPYVLEAAKQVASGNLNLDQLQGVTLEKARAALMDLPGVGRKIADCVLLFSLGFNQAFPVDVWMMRCLVSGWFHGKRPPANRLMAFASSAFGPYGGYAQQYLFHDVRTDCPSRLESSSQ